MLRNYKNLKRYSIVNTLEDVESVYRLVYTSDSKKQIIKYYKAMNKSNPYNPYGIFDKDGKKYEPYIDFSGEQNLLAI